MPQMALGCLSENWLLKELGDLHWDTLCSSLKSTSRDLVDSQGRRLYATFVRIRIDLDGTLRDFGEGDEISFCAEMMRFGRSTVQSTIAIQGPKSSGTASLLTTFSVRTRADSNALLKSEPMGITTTLRLPQISAPSSRNTQQSVPSSVDTPDTLSRAPRTRTRSTHS